MRMMCYFTSDTDKLRIMFLCVDTGGYDLDTVPVRDTSPRRNGTPDSGWDDYDEELDLGLGKDYFVL